jgi:hypothetical protein
MHIMYIVSFKNGESGHLKTYYVFQLCKTIIPLSNIFAQSEAFPESAN